MSTNDQPKGLDILLGVAITFFIATPLTALVTAWSFDVIWTWFVLPEAGTAPTMRTWFGVCFLLSIVLDIRLARVISVLPHKQTSLVRTVFEGLGWQLFLVLMAVAEAAAVRWMAGW